VSETVESSIHSGTTAKRCSTARSPTAASTGTDPGSWRGGAARGGRVAVSATAHQPPCFVQLVGAAAMLTVC